MGLEHVLALAATHPELRKALRRDSDGVLDAAGLALEVGPAANEPG